MESMRKNAKFTFTGDRPMELVEFQDDEIASAPVEQDHVAKAIAQSMQCYLKATKELVTEKYQHFQSTIPDYMFQPGNVLVAICDDGVAIRFEKRTDVEPQCVIATLKGSVFEHTRSLSQHLVHIAIDDAPPPDVSNFGVELKLNLVRPIDGTASILGATRVWFQAKCVLPQEPMKLGAKPYCLLSVRNHCEIELHGTMPRDGNDVQGEQPFIVRAPFRLPVGWECIEVYPTLSIRDWNPEYAHLWAERDILGAALVAQTKDSMLSALDPRASARRQYAALLSEFKTLLDSDPDREQVLQSFLQKNPILLCPTYVRMWPKISFGATVTDFVFRESNKEYLLVELERSTLPLFRQDGHATADLTHAQGQILDWKRYLEDNLATVQRELGLAGITPNPNGLVVIGRSRTLTAKDRRKLQTMSNESPKLRVMTYDDVYDHAKAVFENLLGPIWDPGGTTQVFYPQATEGELAIRDKR